MNAATLLNLDEQSFISLVKSMIHENEPRGNAMCLVALANLPVMLSTITEYSKKHPEIGCFDTLEDHIRYLLDSPVANEDIDQRRRDWFLQGMLVRRAYQVGKDHAHLADELAAIWIDLVDGVKFLPALLEKNIVWSAMEKEWFAPVKGEIDGMEYVLNWMVPKSLLHNSKLQQFAAMSGFRFVGGRFRQPFAKGFP